MANYNTIIEASATTIRLYAALCTSMWLVAPHHLILNAKFQPITVHES